MEEIHPKTRELLDEVNNLHNELDQFTEVNNSLQFELVERKEQIQILENQLKALSKELDAYKNVSNSRNQTVQSILERKNVDEENWKYVEDRCMNQVSYILLINSMLRIGSKLHKVA